MVELTEIMRQKDNVLFAQALNNLAQNSITDADIDLFRNRIVELNLIKFLKQLCICS